MYIMTHGHKLREGGLLEGRMIQGGGGIKGKNWTTVNIINKIYLKKGILKSKLQ